MRKVWLRIALVIMLIPILVFAFLLFERVRGQVSLSRYKQNLIAQREKLDPKDFVSVAKQEENGAPEVFEAFKQLTNGVVLPDMPPPRMKLTESGHAIVGFRETEWIEEKKTNRWDQLAMDLRANEPMLSAIRTALAKPVLDNKVDLLGGPKTMFPQLAPVKRLTFWLGSASELALHENRPHDVVTNLISEIQLTRLLAEDKLLISELVRIAVGAIAKTDTWECLQADGLTDEDLSQIQQAWERVSFLSSMARSLEGERMFQRGCYDVFRQSNDETVGALFWQDEVFGDASEEPFWKSTLKSPYIRLWRFAWLDQDQRRSYEFIQRLVTISRSAVKDGSYARVQQEVDKLQEAFSNRSLYDRVRFPNPESRDIVAGCLKKSMRAETERSIVVSAIALKRHALRHGKVPDSLQALVPDFVSSVPIDYMDGKPIKYRLQEDGSYLLYSVGENGSDEGGDMSLLPEQTLRGPWARKDHVWPLPASPEEVEAFRAKAAQEQN